MPPKGSGGALTRVEERRLWQEVDHLRFFLRYRARLAQTEAADTPDMAYPARSGPDPDATPGAPGYRTTAPWVPAAERRADQDHRLVRDVERGDPYATYPDSYWHGWETVLREECTAVQAYCLRRYLIDGVAARDVATELRFITPRPVTANTNRALRAIVLGLRERRRRARPVRPAG